MKLRNLFLVAVVCAVAACDTGAVREEIEQKAQQVEQNLVRAQQPLPPFKSNPLVVTDRLWVGSQAVRLHRGLPLPEKYETAKGVTFVARTPQSLGDIASTLSSQTGIPVRLGPGVPAGPSASAAVPVVARGAGAPVADAGDTMSVAYEGPLSGLLDHASSRFGVDWRYDGSAILFSRYETRVFLVEVMAGKGKFEDSIPTEAGSNSLKQEIEMKADIDMWAEIGNTVNSILGGTGTAVISPAVGTITVTTTPEIMKSIAHYVAEENKRLVRQLAINVEIYTAEIDNEDDFNNQLTAALKTIKPFTFAGVAAPAFATNVADFSNLTIGIIDNANVSADSVLRAISKISHNVRVAQFPMTTLNGRTITRRVGRDIAYLASSSTTTTGTSGTTTTTLTPGTLREGFSIQLTPRLLADGRVLMQYSLNLIDLVRITAFTSGTSSVQLPETTSRVFVQQSLLRSGSTLVLAGYGQDQTSQAASGTINPYNYLLGGGIGNSKTKQLLLIAITPQELDVPSAEQP
ncbi:MAG: hypothetical protein WDO70_00485 [Alphaproteobacteria bacterium]